MEHGRVVLVGQGLAPSLGWALLALLATLLWLAVLLRSTLAFCLLAIRCFTWVTQPPYQLYHTKPWTIPYQALHSSNEQWVVKLQGESLKSITHNPTDEPI